jgi:uncharacterized damage-inducible protein DinB
MIEGLKTIYDWVRQTREVLFKHCESMPVELYTKELPNFGHGSIRNLQVHVFDVYNGWLLQFARGKERVRPKKPDYPNVAAVRKGFAGADSVVESFLSEFAGELDKPLTRPHPSFPDGLTITPRWLFTHVVTHEFHHKGQITDLCRHLGHPTPDTDLIVPEKF